MAKETGQVKEAMRLLKDELDFLLLTKMEDWNAFFNVAEVENRLHEKLACLVLLRRATEHPEVDPVGVFTAAVDLKNINDDDIENASSMTVAYMAFFVHRRDRSEQEDLCDSLRALCVLTDGDFCINQPVKYAEWMKRDACMALYCMEDSRNASDLAWRYKHVDLSNPKQKKKFLRRLDYATFTAFDLDTFANPSDPKTVLHRIKRLESAERVEQDEEMSAANGTDGDEVWPQLYRTYVAYVDAWGGKKSQTNRERVSGSYYEILEQVKEISKGRSPKEGVLSPYEWGICRVFIRKEKDAERFAASYNSRTLALGKRERSSDDDSSSIDSS